MADFKVTPEKLIESGTEVQKLNKEFNEIMSQIEMEMSSLKSTWESEASERFYQRFKQFSSKFPEYSKIFDGYGKFLISSGTNYKDADQAIENVFG